MLDFMDIRTKANAKQGHIEIVPIFNVGYSKDLMIRGGAFYAIWDEHNGLWSTDPFRAVQIIDDELWSYKEKNPALEHARVCTLRDTSTKMIDEWQKFVSKSMFDIFKPLDDKIIFSNYEIKKEDYSTHRLSYPLEKGSTEAWDKLVGTLYSETEKQKLEWAIGAIVSGDSKHIQKFLVLYGASGTGKSTVLNIISDMFEGYTSVFDAKALGSNNGAFALESFSSNPLIAMQHDGDLSRIEDNTKLNSLVSHEEMTVNEKHKKIYSTKFKSFLFMGTNKPVKITDAKSGISRRLIDVTPSGFLVSSTDYDILMNQITFEYGAIAYKCLEFYKKNKKKYADYIPINMIDATNMFYNFIQEYYLDFKNQDYVTLNQAWSLFNTYCEESNVPYKVQKMYFKDELKNYFTDFHNRYYATDGSRPRNVYVGFKDSIFQECKEDFLQKENWLIFEENISSIFDINYKNELAQYATDTEIPKQTWNNVHTKLLDIDTSKLHYVLLPENHIVIDFDIKNSKGEKDFDLNYKEALKWPSTYAEISKGGQGIHLHYIYTGDITQLSNLYDVDIEIKIFKGKSSLRRRLSKCNRLIVSEISSGLPIKEKKKMYNKDSVMTEKALRELIERNLNKEIHSSTASSVDFIFQILEKQYNSRVPYDVSDLRHKTLIFAMNSTNQKEKCIKQVGEAHWKSEEDEIVSFDNYEADVPIVIFDIEVFPNVCFVNWKKKGKDNKIIRWINPTPAQIVDLCQFKLVGFNNRKYDNHILYGLMAGHDNNHIYRMSKRIISGDRGALLSNAYSLSYTDVYDFCATKQSLKKWEIQLGIKHLELGLDWDKPVDESLWDKVSEYCDNDVVATEAVWDANEADFVAREILAELAGLTVNDTTNKLTTQIIFEGNNNPQTEFNYRFMGSSDNDEYNIPWEFKDDPYCRFDDKNRPIFPGYEYSYGKSTYRGLDVGEGGFVDSTPGIYYNIKVADVASMHPHSIISENLFGDRYTKRFKDLVDIRMAIKHKRYSDIKNLFDGKLAPYLEDESLAKGLSFALKIAINSVYGLTSAGFSNPFRDERNIDNIVAKRGALFMINLKFMVESEGYKVAHIKTDSIKIPYADDYILDKISKYGELYGYTFEIEDNYDRMCLINKAVYISKDAETNKWNATGAQFAHPYVFKTLFTKEDIVFDDLCEIKSVKTALYLDMNEKLPDVTKEEKELLNLKKNISKDTILTKDILSNAEKILEDISKGHDYKFIGKNGRFTPILPGNDGGLLVAQREDISKLSDYTYSAVTGTKGYRWLESEYVEQLNLQEFIDISYYDKLCEDAIKNISQFGDIKEFIGE